MPQHKNVLYLDDSQQLLEERTIEHTVLTQKFTLTTPCNYWKKNNELSAPLQKCTVPWWLPTTTERKKLNSLHKHRETYLDDSLQLLE